MKALLAVPSNSEDTKKLKNKMRLDIIESLHRKGNYNHNIKVLKQGFGELIAKRCPPRETAYKSYFPCLHCLEFYFSKGLYRHVKKCKQKSSVSGIAFKAIQQCFCQRILDISPYLEKVFETIKC